MINKLFKITGRIVVGIMVYAVCVALLFLMVSVHWFGIAMMMVIVLIGSWAWGDLVVRIWHDWRGI